MNKKATHFSQKSRADEIIHMYKEFHSNGEPIPEYRSEILRSVEAKFNSCHTCLLLATYGLYKNGFIKGCGIKKAEKIDYTGFDGKPSDCVAHAIDACNELSKDPEISPTSLKSKYGGDGSIYSFVTAYFKDDLLDL